MNPPLPNPEDVNRITTIFKAVTSGLDIVKKIKGLIPKGTDKKVLEISEEDYSEIVEARELVESIKSKQLDDYANPQDMANEMDDLFGEFDFRRNRETNSRVLVPIELSLDTRSKDLQELEDPKKHSEVPFMVSPIGTSIENQEIKEDVPKVEERVLVAISKLPTDLKTEYSSLIILSEKAIKLYDSGKIARGDALRKKIRTTYRGLGSKFSNLYVKGYLKRFLSDIADKESKEIQKELEEFFVNAESIFFISRGSNVKMTKEEIETEFYLEEDYIAIHSLGEAVKSAEAIVGELKLLKSPKELGYTKIELAKDRDKDDVDIGEYSIIWYKGERGKYYLKLLGIEI